MNLREHHHEPTYQPPVMSLPGAQTGDRAHIERMLDEGDRTIVSALSHDSPKYLQANRQQSAE